ncbi:hydantoinase B/oxoprolinase family protein [Microbulbifer sp. S227A]|uniref:hydantoinase B/oxoprolinase family protein n=1 Tax=Microbulbifer sp. S227A TaxID=3415131 RepID=UPI003C7BDF1B
MTDKMTLRVLANHARAAAENMAHTLHRTAHSAFVKETQDFTVMLMDRRGDTFAVPMELGATWYPGLTYRRALDMVGDYRPGDVAFTNDPYSGHVATHAPDTHLWKPVFAGDEIVAWTGGHIHNTDMGGAVPASLSRSLTEVHQEGIRFPPLKLVKEGVFDETLLRIMETNVRKPGLNIGDIKALVGALNTGERKVHAMLRRFGKRGLVDGIAMLMDQAEQEARAILRGIPDGEYVFADYADEDSDVGNPCRLHLRLRITGDEAVLDFSGSDPQLGSSLNVPTGGDPRHTVLLVGVYYVLYTLNPRILLNTGLTRPFTCITPEGTVLNPVAPAAVGMRSLTCARLRSVIFGAFAQAVPDRMPAAPAGNNCIVNVMTRDERQQKTVIAAVNPVVGGGGGMPHRDGTNGSGADAAYLKNTPIEITETEVPVEFLSYGLARDTGGAGRWRGGLATDMTFRVFSPDTRITARNRDRSRFRPWGILGGRAAGLACMELNPGSEAAQDLGSRDTVVMQPGDSLRIRSAGGGGRGCPYTRPVEAVARDVACGYVSQAAAARDYGVVFRDDEVDQAATEALRHGHVSSGAQFDFGPEREAYESCWTDAAYERLCDLLLGLPVHWRFFAKTEIFSRMDGRSGVAGVEAALAEMCERFPGLSDLVAASGTERGAA